MFPLSSNVFVSITLVIFTCFLVLPSQANQPPTFIKNLDLSVVNENSPIGFVIGTLQAIDPENSSLLYGLEGTNLFNVNPISGVVTVSSLIDRESLGGSVKFNVYVEDIVGGGSSNANNRVRVPITIFIIDENDNQPKFDLDPLMFTSFNGQMITVNISEDSPPGTIVVNKITARDVDLVGSILRVSCKSCAPHFTVNLLSEASTNLISFSVNLVKSISYQPNMDPIELPLTISDGSHSSTLTVKVIVTNVQNKPPVFIGSNTAVVSEDLPIGSLVMTLRAIDGDSLSIEAYRSGLDSLTGNGQNSDARGRPIVYELITNPSECFKLDLKTGQLRVARKLDKEAFPSTNGVISVKVKAIEVDSLDTPYGNREDPLATSIALVTITLQDVNDESPRFNRHEYQVTIPEGVPNGTPLASLDMMVEDRDTGSNSVFNIALDDASGIFSVEPPLATGSSSVSIKVAKGPLDYENPNQRKFILLVTATEAFTKERFSSTSTVTVMIEDVNDNQPTFEEEMYTGSVLEDALAGTIIRTIKATDRDSPRITSLTYSLFGNGAHLFSVHPTTGVITVAECETPGRGNCIDYETRSSYYLSYQASDGFGQTSVVPLTINVMDSNDNPPVFLRDKYTAIIDEGSTKFEPPLKVKARDPDVTSVITYSILSGNTEKLFSIESRLGEIKVNQEIRSKEEKIILKVQASDGGKGLATADVEITVRDANDNSPIFEKESYTASVSESAEHGTIVDRLTATDSDSGLNSEIYYSIEKGSFDSFTIDQNTGVVSVSNSSTLDYDRKSTYNIDIIAVDRGVPARTGTTILTINLINDNDKSPYFYPTTQRCQVNEATAPGTRIHRLNATDPDAESPASLVYRIESVQGVDKKGQRIRPHDKSMYEVEKFFTIDQEGWIVVGSKLNRDSAAVVNLNVSVTDISSSSPTSQVDYGNIIVTLIDHNDSPPTFSLPWSSSRPELTFSIIEELPIGTIVASLMATDLESKISRYSIDPESEYFEINGESGVLTIKKSIDFERLPLISDSDEGQISHNSAEPSLPIRFTVHAYDSGIPMLSATAKVTVNIININDNEPQFEVPFYNTTVPEDSPPGSIVLKVKANDSDRGKFGKISYSIISQAGSSSAASVDPISGSTDNFIIDSETGLIKVAPGAILDREKGLREITLQVAATDNSADETTNSSNLSINRFLSIPVYIKIADVNDNSPTFTTRDYEGSTFGHFDGSSSLTRIPILQVNAEDPDEGINGLVAYRIVSGNTRNIFDIDRSNGMIYAVKSPLEVNGNVKEYKLKIEARDQSGSGPFFDETFVKIKVIEMNRHKPRFIIPSSPTISFLENQKPGTKVVRVEAYDEDNGHNGVVRYSFKKDASTNVQETDEFRIDPDSGLITSKVPFDREERDSYELVLSVEDYMGEPQSFESLQKLTVLIKDMDDNRPEFQRHSNTDETYFFTIAENQPRGSLIGKLTAIDRDVIDKKVYYYLVGSNGLPGEFHIDRTSGQLFSNVSFDRESQQDYYVVVKASSSSTDSVSNVDTNEIAESAKSSNEQQKMNGKAMIKSRLYDPDDLSLALVHVSISDLNDNKPTFTKPIYRAGINHRAEIGRPLAISVKANDPDQGLNSSLVYTISSIDLYRKGYDSPDTPVRPIPSPFTIDTESGKIVTAHLMAQYPIGSRFILHLEAREKASPHRTATAKVYLWVYDETKLIKVTIRMKPEAINARKDEIEELLCNATDSRTIINDIRYHFNAKIGRPVKKWSDVYALVVDDRTFTNLSPTRIIAKLDSRADLLSSENQIQIEEITLAGASAATLASSSFLGADIEDMDVVSIVLMVLVLLLIIGFLSMAVGCCCLRTWYHHKLIESASKAAYKAKMSALKGYSNVTNTVNQQQSNQQQQQQQSSQTQLQQLQSSPESPPSIHGSSLNLASGLSGQETAKSRWRKPKSISNADRRQQVPASNVSTSNLATTSNRANYAKENPLWSENGSKYYEEQELSYRVAPSTGSIYDGCLPTEPSSMSTTNLIPTEVESNHYSSLSTAAMRARVRQRVPPIPTSNLPLTAEPIETLDSHEYHELSHRISPDNTDTTGLVDGEVNPYDNFGQPQLIGHLL